mgnify:FL=1
MNLWIKKDILEGIENLDNYLFISARNAAIRYVKQSFVFYDDSKAKDK